MVLVMPSHTSCVLQGLCLSGGPWTLLLGSSFLGQSREGSCDSPPDIEEECAGEKAPRESKERL